MYFEKPGPDNTAEALEIAFDYAGKEKINHVVLASTWGRTAEEALNYKKDDINMVVVTHNAGFKEPGVQTFDPEIRKKVTENGGHVLTCPMPTRSLGRAIKDTSGFAPEDVASIAWRMMGQGTKVCVEIATMACDAGLIPPGDVVTVAGTGKGADTVLLISAMPSNKTFDMKIKKVLAKPANW
ncbi:MAG: hypothetical protein ACLFQV_07680 [Vulcanimicrobiota bacterium]